VGLENGRLERRIREVGLSGAAEGPAPPTAPDVESERTDR
jgi:hypothetical protein